MILSKLHLEPIRNYVYIYRTFLFCYVSKTHVRFQWELQTLKQNWKLPTTTVLTNK